MKSNLLQSHSCVFHRFLLHPFIDDFDVNTTTATKDYSLEQKFIITKTLFQSVVRLRHAFNS